jgi:parvulin-like peptidyl-prolyl isomerase
VSPSPLLLGARLGLAALALLLVGCGKGAARPGEPEQGRTFFVSHLLYPTGDGPAAPSRIRAEQALHLLGRGTTFEELARTHSADEAGRLNGGYFGHVPFPGERLTAFHGAMQMLAEGETFSTPVLSDLGWHVLRRHTYAEGRALERKYWIPMWAVSITWRELDGGADRSQEEARALAERLLGELRAGRVTLAEVRAQHAPGARSREDGFVTNVPLRPQTKPMFEQLERIAEGEWLGPVEEPQGYAIVRRGRFLRSIVRHIVVQYLGARTENPNIRRMEGEARVVAEQALEAARARRRPWAELVRQFSDDLQTLDDAGSLGCVGNGDLDPSLETAVLDTPPGEVHPKLVRSPFGFHVLWRVD